MLAVLVPAVAQDDVTFDSSGNNLLNGVYNFRQVIWITGDEDTGNLSQSVSMHGTINFDGNGKYELTASVLDSTATGVQSFNRSGSYTISASGYGYLSSTFLNDGKGSVFGLVSKGIFIGSSTEDAFTDLFIAAPAGSPVPTVGSLNGRYWVSEVNLPSLDLARTRDALFQLNPDGQGNLGNISASGYIGGSGRRVTQTVSGARYSFTNGVGTITLGGTQTNTNLLAGERVLFVSPDGNFIFGGSPDGWNMFVGVKALSEPALQSSLDGLWYQAGADVDTSGLADGFATLHTYYGAFRAKGDTQINHQRLLTGFDEAPYDFTYSDFYEIDSDGIYEDYLGMRHFIGAEGAIKIGFGLETTIGISVAMRAPELTKDGVFLNPIKVSNGASFTPFTVGVARGQLITLEGTNLAAGEASDGNLPTTLGGVQVMVNGRPAPIKDVSPTKISALIPYATPKPIAKIQVINNGVESNAVTTYVNTTAPGVFTIPPAGVGFAHAVHADSSPVTSQNPAKPGETITVYMTGLGDVDPPVPDGVAGSASPRSKAIAATAAYLDGDEIDVLYAGLAPVLIGLYQMDVKIPAVVEAGDAFFDVATPDAYTSQVQIPVVAKSSNENEARVLRTAPEQRRQIHKRGRPSRSIQRIDNSRRVQQRVQ